jgi:hypothetical protein
MNIKIKGETIMKFTMKTKRIILFLLFFLFLTIQCVKVPDKIEMFKYEASFDLFMAKVTFTADSLFKSLVDDGTISREVYPDGDGIENWFVFRDTVEIDTIAVEDQLAFDDFDPQSFTQSIDDITINPIEKTISTELGNAELDNAGPISSLDVKLIDILPNLSILPDGTTDTIPENTGIPAPIYRDINFDSFTEATFTSGQIELEIVNNLVIELGSPLKVYLLKTDSSEIIGTDGDTVKAEWNTGIMPGNSSTESIPLANKTLPGELIIKVVGVVCGSDSAEIIVNDASKNSSFKVNAEAKNLEVSSAIADLPSQSIEDSTEVNMDISNSNKIQSATIKNGTLEININNNLALDSKIILILNNLKSPTDQPFSTDSITIIGNNSSNNSYPIENYKLEFDDIDNPKVTYKYSVRTLSEDNVTINSTDNVEVELSIHGSNSTDPISFSQITGKFSQDAITTTDSIEIDEATKITNANFSSGKLTMNIVNNLGIAADINYQINEIVEDNGDTLNSTIHLDGSSIPVIDEIFLDTYNMQFSDATIGFNQIIHYTSSVQLDTAIIQTLFLDNDISVNFTMDNLDFSSVEGIIDSMEIDIDPISTSIEDIPEEMEGINFSNIEMVINLQSDINIPIWLNLKLAAFNEENNDSAIINISQNITANPIIDIPNPENLINIFPDSITVSGSALINGAGSIDINQKITGNLKYELPLEFSIGDSVMVNIDNTEIDSVEDIPEELSALLTAKIDNKFDFGAEAQIYFAKDTLDFVNFFNDTNKVHHLATFNIAPLDTSTNVLSLSKSNAELFKEGGYMKYDILLKGRTDGQPSTFLSTDSLTLMLHGTATALIDIDSLSQGGE